MLRPAATTLCLLLLVSAGLSGCGRKSTGNPLSRSPAVGVKSSEDQAAQQLGFPATATKNTTRVGGADPIADAAGVARAVFPATARDNRPQAVALVDGSDWHAGVAGAVLASTPIRARRAALRRRRAAAGHPGRARGARADRRQAAGGAQVDPRRRRRRRRRGLRTTQLAGDDPFALAARDRRASRAPPRGAPSQRVIVVGADDPAYAMPAAAWAAKAGDPVLFVGRDRSRPTPRRAARPTSSRKIYLVGPPRR